MGLDPLVGVRMTAAQMPLGHGLGSHRGDTAEIVGYGPDFEELQRLIRKVAASDSTVLVRGPTGTGKELVARAVHRLSPRCDAPFIVVDCASMPDTLLQSELFGHTKGAFTGAVRAKAGLFEVAHGGTVFLDEIGDVSPALQSGLLRVLESSTFRRIGDTREHRVDVRLVAATNRNLERMVEQGQFREDLYFRLHTIRINLAPLRQRRQEIPGLVEHFLAHNHARTGVRRFVAPEAMAVLEAYAWPGNIRELRHVVESMLVLADRETLTVADIPCELVRETAQQVLLPSEPDAQRLADVERRHILRILGECRGHRGHTAKILGISERTLYRKLLEQGLDDPEGTTFGQIVRD